MAEFQMSQKRLAALSDVDQMTPALRACVHDYGLPIVNILMKFGVRSPTHIREIVREIWHGPRQESQKSGTMGTLDVLLARGPISSGALVRLLAESSLVIVSCEPTRAMLDASMAEVSGHNIKCSREEKHRRRLRAALRAASASKVTTLRDPVQS